MSYRTVSTLAALLSIALCIVLILLPDIVYWLFGLQGNDLGDFLAKRAGLLFLGLAIFCFYSRNTNSSEVKSIVSLSLGATMGTMALLGVFEALRGTAGLGILLAVLVELIFAALFCRLWIEHRPVRQR